MSQQPQADRAPESLTFEEALDELESLTAAMASGTATLRESVAGYERGAALLRRCREELAAARKTVARLEAAEEAEAAKSRRGASMGETETER